METLGVIACLVVALLDGFGRWYTLVDLSRRRGRVVAVEAECERLGLECKNLEARRERLGLDHRQLEAECRDLAQSLSRVRDEIKQLQDDEERIRGAHEDEDGT